MADATTLNDEELYARAEELRKDLGDLTPEQRQDEAHVRSMLIEAETIDTQITLTELAMRRDAAKLAATRSGGMGDLDDAPDLRSFGEMIITEEMVNWVTRGSTESLSQNLEGRGSLDQLLLRAVSEGGASGLGGWNQTYDASGAGYLLPVGQPIAPVPRQARLYLRDLIPKMTTTLAAIPYVQEVTPTAYENASAVAEGGVKPNATLSFVGAKADPTVIAATLVLSKQLFEDAAAVVQYINQRLPYIVKFKEDWEFLNGSGTWPDIQGLATNGNVQTTASTGDNAIDLGTAFAAVELHDGTPTAVVINPTNAWNMFTKRASTSGIFDAGTPFSALPLTVWGVPTYRTRAMGLNKALVGDFQMGAMIADREQVNVQVYKERYAELNQILLVCEERVGLLNFRPDLFVSSTLA